IQAPGTSRRNSEKTQRQPLRLRDPDKHNRSRNQGRERRRLMHVEYSWPAKEKSHAIGKRVKRVDGMAKATGAAKYTYDVNLKNQLIAKGLGCPHASCTIKSIDLEPAKKVAGVVEVMPLKKEGDRVEFQGDLLVVVAAESEGAAAEGLKAGKIE